MKQYVHWLKIDRYASDDKEQIKSIKEYLKSYTNSKATLYFPDSGSFNWYVRLECNQCYNELDIDVNSFGTNLTRLSSKPKDISESKKSFLEVTEIYV